MKSLASALAALFVSGFYGLGVAQIAWVLLSYMVFMPTVWLTPQPNKFTISAALMLMAILVPLGSIIWGWAMLLGKETTDILLGIFLASVAPGLMIVGLVMDNQIFYWWEPQPMSKEAPVVLMFVVSFVFFGIMTLLWRREGGTSRRFPVQRALQNFVDNSSLGRSSRGVRLLTVVVLAQLLTFVVRHYLYSRMFA